jgi:histidine ammonia-lyase
MLALELITAAEGLEHRKPLKPGRGARAAYEIIRRHVMPLTADRPMHADIETIAQAVRDGLIDESA